MNYIERATQKYNAYKDAGYRCYKPVACDNEAYFISEKDGVTRKHVFTNSSIRIEVIDGLNHVKQNKHNGSSSEEQPVAQKKPIRKKKGV